MTDPKHPEPITIRDKRKIDRPRPDDASATDAAEAPVAGVGAPSEQVAALQAQLDERTADLQRVQAEYANYRKRADRDRLVAGELAIGRVLADLLPVLDDLDRAREHDDLTGGLKAIADKLEAEFAKLGLAAFGEVGDEFDPTVHEAVMHNESAEVARPTCTTVLRRGYRHGERLLRAAMVGVTDPEGPAPAGDEPRDNDADE